MRKLLVILLILIALVVLWLWRGRDLSVAIDKFRLVQASSRRITSLTYEGGGTGGILRNL